MKKTLSLLVIILLFNTLFCFILLPDHSLAQVAVNPAQSSQTTNGFGLQDGSPVRLRTNRTLSSADAKTGDTVDFEVLDDIKIGDITVVPRGGTAIGTITQAKPKGRMGKGGKLDINIDYVRLANGDKAALRAVKENKGGNHTGAMTGAIVASSILFFPAAPFFLFMKGKDITIPKGTEITAYINGDIPLDTGKFNGQPPQTSNVSQPGASQTSNIIVKSAPEGAEISVDGKFVGSTPSTLQLTPGDHKVSVKKGGYVLWERTITINSGSSITIDASLEKMP